jgi:lysophospholipase L1-like esterase
MTSRRRLPVRVAALAVVALSVLAPSIAQAGGPPDHAASGSKPAKEAKPAKAAKVRTYVALGDSYAAGPLVPMQKQPWGCLTSTNNYAELLAGRYGFELRDATCSGAQTKHMTEPQGVSPEPNTPQFDRLDAAVDLVTLQIGGNDIGFSGIAEACIQAAFEQVDCESKYVDDDGRDELRERIARTAPRIAAVLQGIRERSPDAQILVLGYPGIFRIGTEEAGCPAMAVGETDAQYLRGIQVALNDMIAEQAALGGATYVDVYGPSEGKTACDLPVLRWVEPLVPVNAAAPIHPNLTGMIGMADEVVTALPTTWTPIDGALPVNPEIPYLPSFG